MRKYFPHGVLSLIQKETNLSRSAVKYRLEHGNEDVINIVEKIINSINDKKKRT